MREMPGPARFSEASYILIYLMRHGFVFSTNFHGHLGNMNRTNGSLASSFVFVATDLLAGRQDEFRCYKMDRGYAS
jgi:hypothetical protein